MEIYILHNEDRIALVGNPRQTGALTGDVGGREMSVSAFVPIWKKARASH